jgi:teichuronic acid biosynthesis glycosyltransferase TuaC
MTTLVVTSSWPRTGDELAGTFVRTDALVRARVHRERVVVAAPAGPGEAHGGAGLVVVDVSHGDLFGSPGASERVRAAPWRALGIVAFRRALRELVARERPGAIVAHWLIPSGLAIDSVLEPDDRAELELVAHGADVRLLSALPAQLARVLLARITRRAATVRAVSPMLAERLATILPALANRIVVAPMPLATELDDTRSLALARAPHLRESGESLYVVASRLTGSKRVERAVDHVAAVGGRLVLVGDGPMRTSLVRRARDRGVDARFIGARPHDEALAWIAAADVVLVPLARGEGASTVLREASSLGRAVICFDE